MKPGSAKRRKVFVKTGPSAVVANVNLASQFLNQVKQQTVALQN